MLAAVLAPVGRLRLGDAGRSWSPCWRRSPSAWWSPGCCVIDGDARSRWDRLRRRVRTDLRDGLLADRRWVGVVGASTVVVAGHLAMFVLAARTAGSTAPLRQLVPLALLVLLAMAVPLNIAGWGPREGAAAWAFGAAGLGAAQGLATAVAYGVLVLFASLPGAVVLLVALVAPPADRPRTAARPPVGHDGRRRRRAVGSGVHG